MRLGRNGKGATALATTLCLAFAACGTGQPMAGDVLDDYLAAVGGEGFNELQSRVVKGTFELPEMGYEGEFVMTSIPPNLGRQEITIGNMAAASSGVKDGVVWDINPMSGARLLEGSEKRQAIRQLAFDPVLAWEDSFHEAVIQDWDPAEKQIKVLIKTAEGDQVIFYFDRESGLLIRTMTFINGTRIVSNLDDYREVDGIKLAHKISSDLGGSIMLKFAIEEVEHNADIPAETFDLPEQIQKLLK